MESFTEPVVAVHVTQSWCKGRYSVSVWFRHLTSRESGFGECHRFLKVVRHFQKWTKQLYQYCWGNCTYFLSSLLSYGHNNTRSPWVKWIGSELYYVIWCDPLLSFLTPTHVTSQLTLTDCLCIPVIRIHSIRAGIIVILALNRVYVHDRNIGRQSVCILGLIWQYLATSALTPSQGYVD